MTKLLKRVRRLADPYVICLEPGGLIRVKMAGQRKWMETSIGAVYHMACRQEAERVTRARREARLAKAATRK